MNYFSRTLVLTAIAWSATIGLAAAEFKDVYGDTLYDNAINYVESEGIVAGYPDDTFRPSSLITRGEFTKIIVNARYSDNQIEDCLVDNDGDVFDDVSQNHEFADYICVAKDMNLVSGYRNGDFGPGEYITLGEASKILAKAYNKAGSRNDLRDYAEELIDDRVVPNHLRSLNEYVTRGQMAEMIYRIREGGNSSGALREKDLYDRIITMEFENYDSSDAEIRGEILDRLNYSVFKNNEGQRITLDVDKRAADRFLDKLDNDDEDTVLLYINNNKVVYGFIL